ncbi:MULTISPECIES: bifunctional diaminohydroxyphosphoribosylaminopyrimidine deaminase/5-amino-6-(5-phosphoribosylamino)uracil reductase RibD [Arthrobacter]|uniref:Riboflavin biosynthesis protein RibD n=2 Tax=Arthrobacter TaxID=1663 RepID=A0ABU9KIZ8_9MICC|nr:bifunctional diaminohydroxyphosphoribosylaminopyrimidine deaminase/5-amino-6-(5-phosphoribosylamino)uracil reductase RibD [Arthrobacter sp. YJM1]MDP5225900.1 bifunctional diaminohydroxyphosphoribosylaminopyrimidine deaminase/5-amino-6-(5-phosphoribosylamino)uracil reductase RibD [Arthrobacter sp. YJM1]
MITSPQHRAALPAAEDTAMREALAAALHGPRGANPLVGAVILDAEGRVLVTGHHRGAGTRHAEADALAQAREQGIDVTGGTIVVTLEPCNHQGRTGPCAQAIIDAGLARVVYAIDDPHDPAAGGATTLREAGIDVESGLHAEDATALNARWLRGVVERRPFVTLHIAQTLDGRIAAEDGTSQWISGPQSLAHNHGIRGRIDAILVGSGTVAIDDPRLTARTPDGELSAHQPVRAVMGLSPVPDGAALIGTDGRFMHLVTRDPREALGLLFESGVRHVMVEGGSRIIGAFLAAGLVDELVLYQAPTLLGSGKNSVGGLGIGTLADAQAWAWDHSDGGAVRHLGRDLLLHLQPAAPAQ